MLLKDAKLVVESHKNNESGIICGETIKGGREREMWNEWKCCEDKRMKDWFDDHWPYSSILSPTLSLTSFFFSLSLSNTHVSLSTNTKLLTWYKHSSIIHRTRIWFQPFFSIPLSLFSIWKMQLKIQLDSTNTHFISLSATREGNKAINTASRPVLIHARMLNLSEWRENKLFCWERFSVNERKEIES